MKTILKNWKTSLLGGGAFTTGLTLIINDPTQWKQGAGMCLIGLIGILAKDGNVTGK
jgi:hypothetical protein